jgi:hypothetical protein
MGRAWPRSDHAAVGHAQVQSPSDGRMARTEAALIVCPSYTAVQDDLPIARVASGARVGRAGRANAMGSVISFDLTAREATVDFSQAERREVCDIKASIGQLGRLVTNLNLLLQQLDRAIGALPESAERAVLVNQRISIILDLYAARRAVIDAERYARDAFPQ